mgnify:FL=1|tara:strand:+ start:608 stop:1333 length:726 start_codon:yes stop_codon:yes gene_type:complete
MNIILQHYDGDLPDWAVIARDSVKNYAEKIGVEYELVIGNPMGKVHGAHTQKLVYIKEKYDKYDQTIMLDMDICATKHSNNVFDVPRIGVLHDRAMQGTSRTPGAAPNLYKKGAPCFFGNVIKLHKEQRIALREVWEREEQFIADSVVDHYSGDEIVLHYLFHKSGILDGIPLSELCMRLDDNLWWRTENRWDRKFANLFMHSPSGPAADEKWGDGSDKDATFLHFCASQKRLIKEWHKTQ